MTRKDLDRETAAAEEWLDQLDPDATPALDVSDLRAVATAAKAVHVAEADLREMVEIARAHGRSWGRIGISLGVTRQAARQRFGRTERTAAPRETPASTKSTGKSEASVTHVKKTPARRKFPGSTASRASAKKAVGT